MRFLLIAATMCVATASSTSEANSVAKLATQDGPVIMCPTPEELSAFDLKIEKALKLGAKLPRKLWIDPPKPSRQLTEKEIRKIIEEIVRKTKGKLTEKEIRKIIEEILRKWLKPKWPRPWPIKPIVKPSKIRF